MKKLTTIAVFLFFIFNLFGQIIETTGTVNIRDLPTIKGKVLSIVPKGTIVTRLTDSLDYKGWSKVNFNGKIGFIKNNFLKETSFTNAYTVKGNEQTSKVKTYTNSKGNKVQSPTYSNTIPAGATAQCNDGTYSFSQSRRGTCSHHGGVKKWLK